MDCICDGTLRGWLCLVAAALQPLLLATLCLSGSVGAAAAAPGRLAIVIDDLGYRLDNGRRAIALPVTVAVLPHTPHARELAEQAHAAGRSVLLHLPMEPGTREDPGPGALRSAMSRSEFELTLARNLGAVPHISGVNNHMGSRLTSLAEPMDWLMSALRGTGLLFLDSRTTPESVAAARASANAVPTRQRDVFLDTLIETGFIERQLKIAAALARRRGTAVIIGHPHDATLAVLERHLTPEWLAEQQLELVNLTSIDAEPPRAPSQSTAVAQVPAAASSSD